MSPNSKTHEAYAATVLYAGYCRAQRHANPMGSVDDLITYCQMLAHFGMWCAGQGLEASPALYGARYLAAPNGPVVPLG